MKSEVVLAERRFFRGVRRDGAVGWWHEMDVSGRIVCRLSQWFPEPVRADERRGDDWPSGDRCWACDNGQRWYYPGAETVDEA